MNYNLSRRTILKGTASGLLASGTLGMSAFPVFAQDADVEELMVAGPLGEMIEGAADAPITMIEYSSLTCPHCASFHKNIYPDLKKNYIETGKVRFIVREFPLNRMAYGAAMLTRCAPKEVFFPFVDLLFAKQNEWAFGPNSVPNLIGYAKQVGMTQETIDNCLKNQEVLDAVEWVRSRGSSNFGVSGTPTFFINGQVLKDLRSFAQLDALLSEKL
ncbi:MAG: disulfide bond formation protein DsbA [Hyphomicrobiales bacterium]|nr:MAG: disulfide bond formation protein DsbA [Hyphomicrobiales bacterium]